MADYYKRISIILIVILLTAAMAFAKESENPHNQMSCGECHKNEVRFGEAPKTLEFVLNDIVTLCLKCHKEVVNVHHPQRVQVTEEVPGYLPVGRGTSINCITCHNVHSEDTSLHLLMFENIGNYTSRVDICYECHKSDLKKISPHISEAMGISCLTCHQDAPTIKDTQETVTLVDKNIDKICNFCHILDIDTHPRNVDNIAKLSEELPRSSDGKVVCITCHDPHGSISTINFLRERYVIDLEFGKYENPHNVKEYFNCLKCHLDVPKVSDVVICRNKDDFILLCYTCHGADAEKCHPVNIRLSDGMTLPEGFELDKNDLISCVTCHNPDCSGDKKIRYKNMDTIKKMNCNDCHDFSGIENDDPHTGADKVTEDCQYCHKRGANMNEFGMNKRFLCMKCHKFKEHPAKGIAASSIIMSSLIPGVILDKKGKISCTTCHDPHSKDQLNFKLRVVDDMTICEACHQS